MSRTASVMAAMLLAASLVTVQPADASHADYVGWTWNNDDVDVLVNYEHTGEVRVWTLGEFTADQLARVQEGIDAVNQLNLTSGDVCYPSLTPIKDVIGDVCLSEEYVGQDLSMRLMGSADQLPVGPLISCPATVDQRTMWRNVNTIRWGPPTTDYIGIIRVCGSVRDRIFNFHIEYTPDSLYSWDWYFGSGNTPTGDGWMDFDHVVMHEFGHGIGFGVGPVPNDHFDGGSAACGAFGDQIMCPSGNRGATYDSYRAGDKVVLEHAYS